MTPSGFGRNIFGDRSNGSLEQPSASAPTTQPPSNMRGAARVGGVHDHAARPRQAAPRMQTRTKRQVARMQKYAPEKRIYIPRLSKIELKQRFVAGIQRQLAKRNGAQQEPRTRPGQAMPHGRPARKDTEPALVPVAPQASTSWSGQLFERGQAIAQLAWRWGQTVADSVLPRLPGAAASSVTPERCDVASGCGDRMKESVGDEASSVAGKRVDNAGTRAKVGDDDRKADDRTDKNVGKKKTRMVRRADRTAAGCQPPFRALQADLAKFASVHASPGLLQRQDQSLDGVLILFAFETRAITANAGERNADIAEQFAKYARPSDDLLTEAPELWDERDSADAFLSCAGGSHRTGWKTVDFDPAGARAHAEFQQAKRAAAAALKPMMDLMERIVPEAFADYPQPQDLPYWQQTQLLLRAHRMMSWDPDINARTASDVPEYERLLQPFNQAQSRFEKLEIIDLRQRAQNLVPYLQAQVQNKSTLWMALDAALVQSVASTAMQQMNVLVITDKNHPLNIGHTQLDRHFTRIRYLVESVEKDYGRVSISPALLTRQDQSLANVSVIFADPHHFAFSPYSARVEMVRRFHRSGDRVLVEMQAGEIPDPSRCFERPDYCVAIDDTSMLPDDRVIRDSIRTACDSLRRNGVTGLPDDVAVQKMHIYQLMRHSAQLQRMAKDIDLLEQDLVHIASIVTAWNEYNRGLKKAQPQRNEVMFEALKAQVFAEGACFSEIGAAHIRDLEQRILSELHAIIVWYKHSLHADFKQYWDALSVNDDGTSLQQA